MRADYDQMIALENELIEVLGETADVDGHNVGSGETNIFIFTSDPAATFRRTKPVLEQRQQLPSVMAAYREVEGDRYIVVWPEAATRESRIA
jgi:hypothetical protein